MVHIQVHPQIKGSIADHAPQICLGYLMLGLYTENGTTIPVIPEPPAVLRMQGLAVSLLSEPTP